MGKRKKRYRAFEESRADAERALRRFIEEIEAGFAANAEGLTVTAYMTRWIDHAATRVGPRSLAPHTVQLSELHIVPYVGQLKLSDVRPMHLQTLYATLLKNGRRTKKGGALPANSVVHVHRVLFTALRQAVR